MVSVAKSLIKTVIGKFGYEIVRKYDNFPGDAFEAQKTLLSGLGVSRPIIFDIGANRGQTTTKYRSIFEDGTIYSFEPFPDAFNDLKDEFTGDPRVKPVSMAVANESGRRKIFVSSLSEMNSLFPRLETARRYLLSSAVPRTTLEVPVTTIDEFVQREAIDKIDILKLDIEGGELLALQGASDTLRSGNVSLIYLEIMFIRQYEGVPLFRELWSYLGDFRFTLFDIYDPHRAINGQLKYGDALFVSEQLRREVVDSYQEEP